MTGEVSVCHVVNAMGDTSMPADLAVALADHEAIDDVGALVWFSADTFPNRDRLSVSELGLPAGRYRLSWGEYRRVKNVLAGYDVVHTHHPHCGFYGKPIAKRLGKAVVTTEHNDHAGYTLLGRIANGVTNVLSDRVVCVSHSVRDSFRPWENALLDRTEIAVVPNGVNLDRIRAATGLDWSISDEVEIDPDAVVVGSAGSLTRQKAHEVLIDAVDAANETCRLPIELVISGNGERREDLERQIRRSEHPERMHLLGFLERREHVYRMMDEIDIYSMPSRWEGLCVAAIEAMALANPCVFSDIPSFYEPFRDVAVFHAAEDPDELAERLVELAEDPGERAALGDRARTHVEENYALSVTAEAYVAIYRAVHRSG